MPNDLDGHPSAGSAAGLVTVILLLIVVNAIFAAADAALASAPTEEDKTKIHLTTAIRIGSAFATIALGALAGPVWFAAVALLHIVAGVLVPSVLGAEHPDATRRYLVPFVRTFARIVSPVTWLITKIANAFVRVFGIEVNVEDRIAHSPDELRTLVMNAHAQGELEESDRAMLAGVFDFKQKQARDVMRPRTEIAAINIDTTEAEVWEIIRTERYSRYPVYQETLDDVVGVFIVKDMWLRDQGEAFELAKLVREALFIPDSRPAERVLEDLRRTRAYMAVVLDEYGGTAGIITVEDLVEEVMGDIADEYDMASRTVLEMNGVLELAGTMSLIDARSDHRLNIPEGDWTTLGGYAFSQLGRLPKVGDRVQFPDGELEVVAMDGRRVAALRVHRQAREHHEEISAAS